MNNKTKIIIVILPLVLSALTGFAQSAYGDAWNALHWSQQAANSSGEASASYASHAFDGGGHNYGSGTSHNYSSGYSYGSTVTPAQPSRRTATNMSNIGLKISSSGYNRGAELARYYAEQRAERARLKAEREQRMVNSYMQTQYEYTQQMEMSWQIYIANNSHAKPFSQETINEFVSNGLPGNVIIDDNGAQNMLPEALLEGTDGTLDTFEERLKKMNDEEIDQLAKELYNKLDNGEELTDEEWVFLYANELERKARLEEEKRQAEERINKQLENINLDFN